MMGQEREIDFVLLESFLSPDVTMRRSAATSLANMYFPLNVLEPIRQAGGIESFLCLLSDPDAEVRKAVSLVLRKLAQSHEGRAWMHEIGTIDVLLKLLWNPDVEVRRSAMGLLSVLASKDHQLREQIEEAGGIEYFLSLLSDSDTEVREAAGLALTELTKTDAGRASIHEFGGIEALLRLLWSLDAQVRSNAMRVLSILASQDDALRVSIREAGGIESILSLLYQNTEMRIAATSCLEKLAINPQNRSSIFALGGVGVLLVVLQDPDVKVRCGAMSLLSVLASRNDEVRVQIREAGGIEALLCMLSGQDAQVTTAAILCLRELAKNAQNREWICALGGVEELLKLLWGPESIVGWEAIGSLFGLALTDAQCRTYIREARGIESLFVALENNNRQAYQAIEIVLAVTEEVGTPDWIRGGRGIEFFVALLSSEQLYVHKSAFQFLDNFLYSNPEYARRFLDAGGFAHLMRFLRDAVYQEQASWMLIHLIDHPETQEHIRHMEGIRMLVRFCSTLAYDHERRGTLCLFRKLTHTSQNRSLIRDSGGCELLVSVLSYNDRLMQREAAWALANLAEHAESQETIGASGGVEALVSLLLDKYAMDAVAQKALWAVKNLTVHNPENQARLRQVPNAKPFIELLIGFLSHGVIDVRVQAMEVIGVLACEHVEHQAHMVELGIIEKVIDLLSDEGIDVRQGAAGTLGFFSVAPDYRSKIMASWIDVLMGMLLSEHVETRKNAARALCVIAVDIEQQQSILEVGGVEHLVSLLSDADAGVRTQAVAALEYVGLNPEAQERIGMLGGVEVLVDLLSKEAGLRRSILSVLSCLSIRTENQRRLAEAGGIKLLVEMLRDEDGETRRSAVGVLWHLGRNPVYQESMASMGVGDPWSYLADDDTGAHNNPGLRF